MLCWPHTYVWNSLIFVLHLPRFLSGIRPLVPHSHLFIYLCTLIWEFTICQVFNADLSKTVDVVRFLAVFPEPSVCLWGFHLPVSICIYFLPKGIFTSVCTTLEIVEKWNVCGFNRWLTWQISAITILSTSYIELSQFPVSNPSACL